MDRQTTTGLRGASYRGWRVAWISALGLAFSYPALLITPFSLFLPLWARTLDAGPGAIGLAISAAMVAATLGGPLAGLLLDRFPARTIIAGSAIAMAVVLAGGALLVDRLWHLWLLYFLATLAGSAAAPVGYSRLLLNWFHRSQGRALGLALAGAGVGAIVTPLLAGLLIATGGWRVAFVGFGLILGLVIVPLVYVTTSESPDPDERAASGQWEPQPGSGVDAAGAPLAIPIARTFALLAIFFLLTGFALTGTISHFVAIIGERGVEALRATPVIAAMGTTIILGRIGCGAMLDRFFAPRVAALFMTFPLAALALLSFASGILPTIAASLLFGLGTGAEMAILAYCVRSYFPLAQYGRITGLIFAAFNIGSAIGAPMAGFLSEGGGYGPYLGLAGGVLGLAIAVTFLLPAYPAAAWASEGTAS